MAIRNLVMGAVFVATNFLLSSVVQAETSTDCSAADEAISKLINEADPAGDVWQYQSCGRALHIQSGLSCETNAGDDWTLRKVIVFPSGSRTPTGQDVACDYTDSTGSSFTLYATNFDPDIGDEDQFNAATAAIRQRFPGATSVKILTTTSSSENGQDIGPLAAAYSFELEGQPYQSAIWLRTINGWSIKLRATYLEEAEAKVLEKQLSGNLVWLAAAQDVRDNAITAD